MTFDPIRNPSDTLAMSDEDKKAMQEFMDGDVGQRIMREALTDIRREKLKAFREGNAIEISLAVFMYGPPEDFLGGKTG